jgi:hypothetical protein
MKLVNVATCRFRIFTHLLPIVAGLALDVLGDQEVQLFRHTNAGGFLFCPCESGKGDTCHLPNHLELHSTP